MKFCANCGNQMEDAQRFCPQCGNDTMAAQPGGADDYMTRGAADPNAGQYQQSYGAGQQQYNGGVQQQPYENNSGYQNMPYGSGYPQPGADYRRTNGMGVAALVCSLVGILILGIVLEPLAIIFGGVCISQCNNRPDEFKGKGLGTAGMIIGIIAMVLVIIGLVMAGSIAGTILSSL